MNQQNEYPPPPQYSSQEETALSNKMCISPEISSSTLNFTTEHLEAQQAARKQQQIKKTPKSSQEMNYVIFSEALEENRSLLSFNNDNNNTNNYRSEYVPASTFHHSAYQATNPRFSVRVTNTEERIDPAGSTYTVYIMQVESNKNNRHTNVPIIHSQTIEHRYSEFSRLNKELEANAIPLRANFPSKSLAGRIGNWTPAARFAPSRMHEMVTCRKIKLDIWLVELAELLKSGALVGVMKDQVVEFLTTSCDNVAPCNRANFVQWESLDGSDSNNAHNNAASDDTGDGIDNATENNYNDNGGGYNSHYATWRQREEDIVRRQGRHAAGGGFAEKYVSNPLSFTMGSEIRKAVYTVMYMCGTRSNNNNSNMPTVISSWEQDRSIPLDLLHQAWGLCFLTVVKAGFMVSGRVGTGLIIARTSDGGWSAPSAVGTVGIGWGALIGGDITTYLIVLNTKNSVRAFCSPNVNLGAEVGVAVGPIGRGGTGNLNAGPGSGGVVAAYSYAHSKGLFMGISLEGSVITTRKDVNAKFYGKRVDAGELLFGCGSNRPRAAIPLYDALEEATKVKIDRNYQNYGND